MRNVRVVEVSPALLAEALHMPDASQIINAQWDPSCGVVRLYVAHPSFPEVQEGCPVDRATLTITKRTRTAEPEDWIHTYEGKW